MSADPGPRQYEIVHTTAYDYSQPVAVSQHQARLCPRDLTHQQRLHHDLQIDPVPAAIATHTDYFGNEVTFFAMQGAHKRLTVRARSVVTVHAPRLPPPLDTPAWETVADRAMLPLEALQFLFDGALMPAGDDLTAYARVSFPAGRPLLDAVLDLTRRIHEEFTFDREATTVGTPLADVFSSRRGVCQDFARLEIACLRSLGLPARYISGYLETIPPPGRPRLVGADASHAWLAVYCPPRSPGPSGPGWDAGWIEVDPTNNLLASQSHVTLGWGRDYHDVSPIHGVILGGGTHTLKVNVDVVRVSEHGAPGLEARADLKVRLSD